MLYDVEATHKMRHPLSLSVDCSHGSRLEPMPQPLAMKDQPFRAQTKSLSSAEVENKHAKSILTKDREVLFFFSLLHLCMSKDYE
jgi:hypothetical protein